MAEDDAKNTPSGRSRRADGPRDQAASTADTEGAGAPADAEGIDGGAEGAEGRSPGTGRRLSVGALAAVAAVIVLALILLAWPAARDRVAAMFSSPEPAPQGPTVAERLDMLEGKLIRIEDALATLRAAPASAIESLGARVAALEKKAGEPGPADAALGGVEGRLKALEGRLAALAERLEGAPARPAATGTLALMGLADALRGGAPFTAFAEPARAALAEAGGEGAGDGDLAGRLARLAPYAETGVPAEAALLARFAALPRGAAKAPEGEADGGPGAAEGGLWERIRGRISGLVVIRRVEESGEAGAERESTESVVVKDLEAALAAVEGATGPEVEAWRRDARARLAADRLARDLGPRIGARLAAEP